MVCALDGRPRLEELGNELRYDATMPPERLIAVGYEELGDGLLERLRGEFAVVLWDRATSRGLIARDRTGARPIFVAHHGRALLFASEVRNLLDLLPSRPAPDAEGLAHWIARAPAPDDRTLFAGIRRLPPGHALLLESLRWRTIRFWQPSYKEPPPVDRANAIPGLRRALGRAVNRAIDGAERPAILLSGGLDSAAVAAVGRDSVESAYSGVFPGHPDVDEQVRIRRARDWLGIPGVQAQLGAGSALRGTIEFMSAWELPSASPNRFVWDPLYRRAAADGVDVLLTGDGGDELFGCAYYLIADQLLAGRPRAALRIARRLPGMGEQPRRRWIARALLAYGVRGALPYTLHERLRAARGRAAGPEWLARPARDMRWAWKRSPAPRWWAHMVHVLTADPLGASEQLSREASMHGVTFRHPLREPDLIEFVLGLPPELGFDPKLDRPLLRSALADELPEALLLDVRKPVFNPVLEAALAGPDGQVLREVLRNPHPSLLELMRPGPLGVLTQPLSPGAAPPARALDLWRLASAQIWVRYQDDRGLPQRLLDGLEPAPEVPFTVYPARPRRTRRCGPL